MLLSSSAGVPIAPPETMKIFARMLIRHRLFQAAVTRQAVVTAGLVIDRTDDGRLVHPLGRERQQLANLDARHVGVDGLELAADFLGGGRF